jgi:hypothetical protein
MSDIMDNAGFWWQIYGEKMREAKTEAEAKAKAEAECR